MLYVGENIPAFLEEAHFHGLLDFLEYIVISSDSEVELEAGVAYCKSKEYIMESFNRIYFIKKDHNLTPFHDSIFDCIVSNCELNYHPDMPNSIYQYYHMLNPDGFLIGCVLGGETLKELRIAFNLAEEDLYGGQGVRVNPSVLGSDINNYLQKANYIIPNVDVHTDILHFDEPYDVMDYIRMHGESNCVNSRNNLSMPTLLSAMSIYKNLFSSENVISREHILDSSMIDFKGKTGVFATVQYIYFIGWKRALEEKSVARERGSITRTFAEFKEEIADANKDDETFDKDQLKYGRMYAEEDPRLRKKSMEAKDQKGMVHVDYMGKEKTNVK